MKSPEEIARESMAAGAADVIPMSRSRAKRLFNMHKAEINQVTDHTRHAAQREAETSKRLHQALEQEATASYKLGLATAVIEQLIRKYGPQTFPTQLLLDTAEHPNLAYDNQGASVHVLLRDPDE